MAQRVGSSERRGTGLGGGLVSALALADAQVGKYGVQIECRFGPLASMASISQVSASRVLWGFSCCALCCGRLRSSLWQHSKVFVEFTEALYQVPLPVVLQFTFVAARWKRYVERVIGVCCWPLMHLAVLVPQVELIQGERLHSGFW